MPRLEIILTDPGRARRLYLGLNTGLGLLVLLLLVWPLADLLLDQRAQIAALSVERAGQVRLAERGEKLLAEQAALAGLDGLAADYLPGEGPALAGAQLQGLLVQQLTALGGQLVSVQVLPPDPDDDRRVGVRLDAALTHDQLRRLLHAVEGGRPRLVVTGLDLRPAADDGGRLSLSLTVVGLRRAAGGQEP